MDSPHFALSAYRIGRRAEPAPRTLAHLAACCSCGRQGGDPFALITVGADGVSLPDGRNRVAGGDAAAHPELAMVRWALANVEVWARAVATVHACGERGPMPADAHEWAALRGIVFVDLSAMLEDRHREWESGRGPVAALPVSLVVPRLQVDGPDEEPVPWNRDLHFQALQAARRGADALVVDPGATRRPEPSS